MDGLKEDQLELKVIFLVAFVKPELDRGQDHKRGEEEDAREFEIKQRFGCLHKTLRLR